MRSLFLKIFLWFWATVILTAVALLVTFVLQPGGVPARWHAALGATAQMYGRAAVGAMEGGGAPAVANYLDDLDRNAHTEACLFDADGNPIAGHDCPSFQSLVKRAVMSTSPTFGFRYGLARVGLRVLGRNGGAYIFATELPAGPRAAFGPNLLGLALHWGVAFLVSGFICYLLTRHLTTPILRLRQASRRLANGELATRAAGFETRHDELGALVRDFNSMGDRIEALLSSQRQLISDVSHELRSPLARLTVALDLARERMGNDPAFAHMERGFDRLSDMVGRLLTVARLDASARATEMKALNLSALVSEVVADAEFESRNRNCTVQPSIETDICVRGNGDLLRSAIEDVIRNAVRYTAPGTAVEVQLRRADAGSASCILTVRDHGPGVPDSELANIFRPFYRVASARDRQSGGAGLGLAIADRIARLHGGSVCAVNTPGGLEIVFNLPVAEFSSYVPERDSSRRAN
jgi:two-component system, OmpR family, sensor histidine kinase CpxA